MLYEILSKLCKIEKLMNFCGFGKLKKVSQIFIFHFVIVIFDIINKYDVILDIY